MSKRIIMSALSQAQNFIGKVGKLDENDLPPVLDVEKMDEFSDRALVRGAGSVDLNVKPR